MELQEFIELSPRAKKQFFIDNININVKFAHKPIIYKDTGDDISEIDAQDITHEMIEENTPFGIINRIQMVYPEGIITIPNYKIYNLDNLIDDINVFATGTVVIYYEHWEYQATLSSTELGIPAKDSIRYYIL